MRGGGRRGRNEVVGGVSGREGVSGDDKAGEDKEEAGDEYIAAVKGVRLIQMITTMQKRQRIDR